MQTSVSPREEYISPASEVTHLEVPLSRFEEVMFPDQSTSADIDTAAEKLLRDTSFLQLVQSYLNTQKDEDEDVEDESSTRSSELSAEDYILKIFSTMTARLPQSSEPQSPPNIKFVDVD